MNFKFNNTKVVTPFLEENQNVIEMVRACATYVNTAIDNLVERKNSRFLVAKCRQGNVNIITF